MYLTFDCTEFFFVKICKFYLKKIFFSTKKNCSKKGTIGVLWVEKKTIISNQIGRFFLFFQKSNETSELKIQTNELTKMRGKVKSTEKKQLF